MAKNLRDLAIIPPETKERFLPLGAAGLAPLRTAGAVLAGSSRFSPGYEIVRPRPDIHLALYALEGDFLADLGRGLTKVSAPGLLSLPVGSFSHYRSGRGPWRALWFHLRPVPGWDMAPPPKASWSVEGSGARIEALVEGLLAELDGPEPDAADAIEGYSRLILLHLRRDLGGRARTPGEAAFDRTVAWIREDLARAWTLAEMAAFSGLSLRHLNRLFHERWGVSPRRFVTEVRMRHAQELIEHTALGLDGVARAVGYENVFAFSTAFKRSRGRAPSSFRR